MKLGYGRAPWRDDGPHSQAALLRAAGCDRLYLESASTRGQPSLALALAAAKPGDVLVVCQLDRLARSVRQVAEIVTALQLRNVGLRVLDRDLDTTREDGRLVFDVLTTVAAFEQELMLERRHLGSAPCARRGGRKPAMGELEIRKAMAMLSDPTLTVGEVARQIGVQPSTLYRHIPGGRSALAEASA